MLGDGAVDDPPRGTICYISPIKPDEDRLVGNAPHRPLSTDFDALRKRLLKYATARDEEEDTQKADGDDETK
jgi:hypothetical protein